MADCHMAGLAKWQIVIWHFRLWQIAHGKLYDGELTLAKYQNCRHELLGSNIDFLQWEWPSKIVARRMKK